MQKSRRVKRVERYIQSQKRPVLNLVSLMDIFTILVFFLLVSSSNVQQLPNKKDIKLPTSVARKAPKETLVVMITPKKILVQGRPVADLEQVVNSEEALISGLQQELRFHASTKSIYQQPETADVGKAITIMGDENISYGVLRKILATCRDVNYTRIAFAAVQTVNNEGEQL